MTESPSYTNAIEIMSKERITQWTENLWNLTGVQRMHEQLYYLRREESRFEVQDFLEGAPIRENLPFAKSYFEFSRESAPLQPLVHLRLGEIKSVIGGPREADVDFERALKLAPSNPEFHKVAGIYYLQSGEVDPAVPHFKKYLELRPTRFSQLMNLITGRTTRIMARLDEPTIAKIIPDDAQMLFDYVVKFMPENSPLKSEFLERAARALAEAQHNVRSNDVLEGDIRSEQGDLEAAAESYKSALIRQPNDPKTRYKRAQILVELGDLDEALKEAKYLTTHTAQNRTYNKFLVDVESAMRERDQQ
jgi:tetratricopeptide (TPR) repeat protein